MDHHSLAVSLLSRPSFDVVAWIDPICDGGLPADSDEALVLLCPVLGPSATLMLHRLARYAVAGPTTWEPEVFAATFGLASGGLAPKALSRLSRFGFATIGVCLLNEVRDDNGNPVVTAVCQAATSYADHVFYCHGVGSARFWLGYKWYNQLSEPVMSLSEACYRAATGRVGQLVCRGMFDGLEMGAPVELPGAQVLARVTSRPPSAEAAWIQQRGLGVRPN